jgi:Holliday junction resolvase RusA-like endonuclease
VRLILPVPPSWNATYRAGKGRFYTPVTVIEYRKAVELIGRIARVPKYPREVEVCVSVWWYRKRQAGDLDKRNCTILDALQGVWYVNDAQVAEQHLYRLTDKVNPRLEVEVVPIANQGGLAA